jgi:hypothetical protein
VLRNLTYDSKSKNFTFDKFTAKHSDYHMSADNLAGFNSLTQEMRCQLFVSGIPDPAFEVCKKAHVIAQGTMMSDFSAVKTYFTNYARQGTNCADDDDPPLGDDSGDTPTLEAGDSYITSELLFPCNSTLAKGKVTARKRDAITIVSRPIRVRP